MRTWLTGINGFLASHVADTLLSQGHEVYGNDNFLCSKGQDNWSGGGTVTDCRDFNRMVSDLKSFQPDTIIHAAATAHEGLSSFSPSFVTQNIFEASVATFSAAIAAGVSRIIFMSSMSRYGDNKPPFTEDMTPRPKDCYAIAKVAAEDVLKNLCQTHGIKWSILVPHSIIGPRQNYTDPHRNVASIMINRCLQGRPPIIYGDGFQTRCFSPVSDCIPSIIKAVHGEADGEIVNIGPDDGEISIRELAEKVANLTGYNGYFEYYQDRPNEVKHAFCSSDKVRKMLGFKPTQSLDDCLRETVEYVKAQGPKPFDYSKPLEIITERTPRTWVEHLI